MGSQQDVALHPRQSFAGANGIEPGRQCLGRVGFVVRVRPQLGRLPVQTPGQPRQRHHHKHQNHVPRWHPSKDAVDHDERGQHVQVIEEKSESADESARSGRGCGGRPLEHAGALEQQQTQHKEAVRSDVRQRLADKRFEGGRRAHQSRGEDRRQARVCVAHGECVSRQHRRDPERNVDQHKTGVGADERRQHRADQRVAREAHVHVVFRRYGHGRLVAEEACQRRELDAVLVDGHRVEHTGPAQRRVPEVAKAEPWQREARVWRARA